MRSILDAFEINKNTNPDKAAVICEEKVLTYSELYEYSDRFCNKLLQMGLNKGDKAAILFPNITEFVVSYYAVLKAGGIVLPVNVIDTPDIISRILKDAGVKYIIYWDKFENLVNTVKQNLNSEVVAVCLGGNDLPEKLSYQLSSSELQGKYQTAEVSLDDVSSIFFTSGTTGVPKGAVHSHKNLTFVAKIWKELFSITRDDVFLAVLPLFHPFSQTAILIPSLWYGATLVLHPRINIDEIIAAVNRNSVTHLYVVPSLLRMLLQRYDETKYKIPSVKYCVSGINSNIEKDVVKFEEIFKIPLIKCYGTAETLFVATCSRLERGQKPRAVGFPIKEAEIQILDNNGLVLSTNDVGEILIRGEHVMKEYVNQPEFTARALKKGWFYTGDMGMQDDDGFFYVIDKKNDVINKGGFPVYPSEIEYVLMRCDKIKETAAVGVYDKMKFEEVKVFIVLNNGKKATSEDIISYCRENLPLYKCPKYVQFLDSLPKSSTGKILRKSLKNSSN